MAYIRVGILIAVLMALVSAAPQGYDEMPVVCNTPSGKSGLCVHYYFCDPGFEDFDVDLNSRQCGDILDMCCPKEYLKYMIID